MAKFNLGTLFGDRDLQNMLQRVDTLSDILGKNRIPDPDLKDRTSDSLNQFISTIKEDSKENSSNSDPNTIKQLLESITIPAQRSNRYRIYDEIYSSVQIVKSIIKVYINNTLQRDIITGRSIVYMEAPEFKTNTNQVSKYKKFNQSVINSLDIETKLTEKVLHDFFRYGDHYIEIIDLQNDITNLPSPNARGDDLTSSSANSGAPASDIKMLTEASEFINLKYNSTKNNQEMKESAIEQCVHKIVDQMVEFDHVDINNIDVHDQYSLFYESKDIEEKKKTKDIEQFQEHELNRILLRFHDPRQFVVLTTAHNNSVVGYVEVKESKKMEITPGVGMQFASMIKQISAISKSKQEDHSAVVRRIVKRIIEKMVKDLNIRKPTSQDSKISSKEINRQYEQVLHQKLGDDLFYLIKRLYLESDPKDNSQVSKVSIRFIPTDRIIPLVLNPVEYSPYGTSIIDPLIYPAKLYLLTQLTNIVTKLSRAALIRKWTIETGPREHHTNLMQTLKRELRNQRITVDDIISFKSIPKIMSDFKDMILLTKKGVKFVDVDVQSFGDPNIKIADLEDIRKELIALSGIPAPYLGYNDVVDLREQLVNVNITFATNIISVQTVINMALSNLCNKIAKILGYSENPSKYVSPSLKPPVILLLQMLESTMSSVGNIQMSFQGSGIEFDPFYLLKKFVTSIDWEEFSQEAREYTLFKIASGGNQTLTPQLPGGA